jgi:rRNA processing protein Krr1/Pno1
MWRSQENILLILDIIDVKDVVQNENKTFDKNYQEI